LNTSSFAAIEKMATNAQCDGYLLREHETNEDHDVTIIVPNKHTVHANFSTGSLALRSQRR
jgi:hypothetical protein